MRDPPPPLAERRFPGIHGHSLSSSDESFDANLIQNFAANVRKASTPTDVGRVCARMATERRKFVVKPWDSGSTAAGTAGLFDIRLGGDLIPISRGDGRKFRSGDRVYRQNAFAASQDRIGWFGRFGYRAISGYEPFRIDSDHYHSNEGLRPWFLSPKSPPVMLERSKSRDELWLSETASPSSSQELHRTVSRVPSPESWSRFCPRQLSSNEGTFWERFDVAAQLHIPETDMKNYFGNRFQVERALLPGKRSKSKFCKLAEQSFLWELMFKEWLPTSFKQRMSANLSLKLEEISTRIFAELYEILKIDWFTPILELERRLTDDGFKMRAKGELEKAEADAKYRASELQAIQKLVLRCAQERSEAEAAENNLKREEAQFIQSYEALLQSKALLEEAEREAQKEGGLSEAEEENMVRLRLNIEIAEARTLKEKGEFLEANALREKERRDLAELEGRLKEREAAFKFAAEEARANNALLNGNQKTPFYSVMNRIYAYESTLLPPAEQVKIKKGPRNRQHAVKSKHNKNSSISQQIMDRLDLFLDDQFSSMTTSDESGYVGEVVKGRPEGNGIEWYKEARMEYIGQFKDDLREGLGCLVFLSSQIFYAGEWVEGVRSGRGIVGYMAVDHRTNRDVAIPVAWVRCESNQYTEVKKYRRKDQEASAFAASLQAEVQKAVEAAASAVRRKEERNVTSTKDA